jgi:hypothetical protein
MVEQDPVTGKAKDITQFGNFRQGPGFIFMDAASE